ncbi:MAG: PEP-CTERM sorting domain-containing protein [Akkermansia sp.]|nr:PEP-CTERM sorting domain-containing protein [Akkermansia sp.]
MKKTLSLLALAALSVGATVSAATHTFQPELKVINNSYYDTLYTTQGAVLTPGATLINTVTTGIVSYDHTVEPKVDSPFDINGGASYSNLNLNLTDVAISSISPGDTIILDFNWLKSAAGNDIGYYLNSGTTVIYRESPESPEYTDVLANYIVVQFNDVNFLNDVYAESPVSIYGLFADGRKAEGYIVSYACDEGDSNRPSPVGGIVFFNESVTDKVHSAEVVPEPTTATLSLLALAGLVARRRRK